MIYMMFSIFSFQFLENLDPKVLNFVLFLELAIMEYFLLGIPKIQELLYVNISEIILSLRHTLRHIGFGADWDSLLGKKNTGIYIVSSHYTFMIFQNCGD